MDKDAVISEDGVYRYTLSRTWDYSKGKVAFMMLNPSTADATDDDATVRRCINFAKSWGYGGIYIGNLFAYRSRYPKDLLSVDYPIGPKNLMFLARMFVDSEIIVCAWGNGKILKALEDRAKNPESIRYYYEPLKWFRDKLTFLELSKDTIPKHPLYLRGNLTPKPYKGSHKVSFLIYSKG